MSHSDERIWLPRKLMGARIKRLREEVLGLTQDALGVALGYSEKSAQSTVWQMEEGKRGVPEEKIVRLSKMANVSVTYFMVPEVVESDVTVDKNGWSAGYHAALDRMEAVLSSLRSTPNPTPVEDLAEHVVAAIDRSVENHPGDRRTSESPSS